MVESDLSDNIHLCIIFHIEYPPSSSTAINEYTRHLARNGFDVSLIAGRENSDTPAKEEVNGVDVYRIETDLSTSVSPEPTRFGYRALKFLENEIGIESVDILQLRSFPNLGLILTPLPWKPSPFAVVSDVRGTAVSNPVFEKISHWGIRLQDYLVDETTVIDEHVRREIFPGRDDIPIVPIGADFERFTPDGPSIDFDRYGIDDEDIVLGYTGNLHSSRELERLIHAFSIAHEEHPRLKLVFVGDGDARTDLEQSAVYRGVADAITFVGSVPFEEVPAFVRSFDIGAAYIADKPQYRNQPPLKTVEFLASSLPVVATNTPGNRRFVGNRSNGLLSGDSPNEYAQASSELCEDSSVRATLKEKARESVREFDYERIVTDRLIPIYERLCTE